MGSDPLHYNRPCSGIIAQTTAVEFRGTYIYLRRFPMTNNSNTVVVSNNATAQRYEAQIGDQLGLMEYHMSGDIITFTHTEVPEALEGHGLASQMARFALDDAQARGLKVVPQCPFVAGYIQRHPEYEPLVARSL
jgi:predicted GNAT family acetyltransferase